MTDALAPPRTRAGLAARLLLALGLVVLSGAATAWLVAAAIGPSLFHDHMLRAGLDDHDAAVVHAEEAFRSASTVSLTLALGTAALTSLAVSLLLTRRIGRSLSALSGAASRLGSGRYEARVQAPGLGAEFDDLADAFNHMATRLEDGERLRARLLADVAHEVRTPVATITGYLEAVEDGFQPLDEATLALLRDQAGRLTRLADDLAAVTRAESGDLHLDTGVVAAGELVTAAVQAGADRAAVKGVTLRSEVGDAVPAVTVDRHRMAQVLDNLVNNAIRHTQAGGTVTVGARHDDGHVLIAVRDTGEGIAAEHLLHVFERFYRADTARDRARGGSGIGLAIAKALTEAQGGTITAASPGTGRGTTFTIALPAVAAG